MDKFALKIKEMKIGRTIISKKIHYFAIRYFFMDERMFWMGVSTPLKPDRR